MTEEAVDLIQEAARDAGYEVSSTQLRRWARVQLVGTPRQQGLGQGLGTRTLYPEGTAARVVDICRLSKRHRSIRDITWSLWWGGVDIPDNIIRTQLEEDVITLRSEFDQLAKDGELTEAAQQAIDASGKAALPSRAMRHIRRRIGGDAFETFMDSLLTVAVGHTDLLPDEDIAQLEHGLSFDSARTESTSPGLKPWAAGDPREDFATYGRLLQPERVEVGLRTFDGDLRLVRNEAHDFILVITTMGQIVRTGFGRWKFGFGFMGEALEEMAEDPDGQRRFVLLWLCMRTPELFDGMQAILGQAEAMKLAAARQSIMEGLLIAVPAVGEVVSARDLARASVNTERGEELVETIKRLRETHGTEIDSYFAALRESGMTLGLDDESTSGEVSSESKPEWH